MRTKLKLLRIENHLTQEEMAKRLDTSRNNYNFIENGKRKGGADFWFTLQKTFNVPIEKMDEIRKIDSKGN